MSREVNPRKAAVIGCGFVGSATAFTLMQSRLFSELVLLDVNMEKADGEAKDIAHGIPFAGQMKIYAGTYDDAADAAIIIITAGANQKPAHPGSAPSHRRSLRSLPSWSHPSLPPQHR